MPCLGPVPIQCRVGSRLAVPDASDGTGAGGQGPQGRTTPPLSPPSAPACDCQPLGAQPLLDPKSVSSALRTPKREMCPLGTGSYPIPAGSRVVCPGAAEHIHRCRPPLPVHTLSPCSLICLFMLGFTRVTLIVKRKKKKGRMYLEMLVKRFLTRPRGSPRCLSPPSGTQIQKAHVALPVDERFPSASWIQQRPDPDTGEPSAVNT